MRRSIGLTVADRAPWLDALIARLNQQPEGGLVLACSALTRAIRERFRTETRAKVVIIYLKTDHTRLLRRLTERTGHFASAGLLASQLETLEEPAAALIVDADQPPEVVCQRIREQLAACCPAD
jgi:gluconokinase